MSGGGYFAEGFLHGAQARFVPEWMQQPTRGLGFLTSLGQGFSLEQRLRLIVEWGPRSVENKVTVALHPYWLWGNMFLSFPCVPGLEDLQLKERCRILWGELQPCCRVFPAAPAKLCFRSWIGSAWGTCDKILLQTGSLGSMLSAWEMLKCSLRWKVPWSGHPVDADQVHEGRSEPCSCALGMSSFVWIGNFLNSNKDSWWNHCCSRILHLLRIWP